MLLVPLGTARGAAARSARGATGAARRRCWRSCRPGTRPGSSGCSSGCATCRPRCVSTRPGSRSRRSRGSAASAPRWRALPIPGGGRGDGDALIAAAQEDELRAFANLVARRRPVEGELAWALERFELGCERDDALTGLTDHLLALRALLEPEGPRSGRLAGRVAALCAPAERGSRVTERVARAISLEQSRDRRRHGRRRTRWRWPPRSRGTCARCCATWSAATCAPELVELADSLLWRAGASRSRAGEVRVRRRGRRGPGRRSDAVRRRSTDYCAAEGEASLLDDDAVAEGAATLPQPGDVVRPRRRAPGTMTGSSAGNAARRRASAARVGGAASAAQLGDARRARAPRAAARRAAARARRGRRSPSAARRARG